MDDYEMDIEIEFHNPKEENRAKYKRSIKHDANLKQKAKNSCNNWYHNYHWKTEKRTSKFEFSECTPYLKKYYKSSHSDIFKYHKKNANKKVRRSAIIQNGNAYRKIYEMLWLTD